MTTKKQRREQVAAKSAARREADRLLGLEAQRIAREKREREAHDAERAEKSKRAALALKKKHDAEEAKKEMEDFNKFLDGLENMAVDVQRRAYEDAVGVQSVEAGAEEKY